MPAAFDPGNVKVICPRVRVEIPRIEIPQINIPKIPVVKVSVPMVGVGDPI